MNLVQGIRKAIKVQRDHPLAESCDGENVASVPWNQSFPYLHYGDGFIFSAPTPVCQFRPLRCALGCSIWWAVCLSVMNMWLKGDFTLMLLCSDSLSVLQRIHKPLCWKAPKCHIEPQIGTQFFSAALSYGNPQHALANVDDSNTWGDEWAIAPQIYVFDKGGGGKPSA